MGKSQRTKGAVGEREVAAIFSAGYDRGPFKRNIGQARDGGNDIDVGPFLVEVKRRKTLGTIYSWLQQAVAAARGRSFVFKPRPPEAPVPMNAIPLVIARQDNGEWLAVLRLEDFISVTRDGMQYILPPGVAS